MSSSLEHADTFPACLPRGPDGVVAAGRQRLADDGHEHDVVEVRVGVGPMGRAGAAAAVHPRGGVLHLELPALREGEAVHLPVQPQPPPPRRPLDGRLVLHHEDPGARAVRRRLRRGLRVVLVPRHRPRHVHYRSLPLWRTTIFLCVALASCDVDVNLKFVDLVYGKWR